MNIKIKMKPKFYRLCCFFLLLLTVWSGTALALTFSLPSPGDSVVGRMQWTQARAGDTFSLIGRRYDIGYYQLVEANPGIDAEHVPAGTIIVVPSRFILPAAPRTGIVLNEAELRIYYYPKDRPVVVTYPVGIGREGWDTILGSYPIIQKSVNPTWYPPDSIREARAKEGVDLPKSVPPGPDNPLGGYRMRLSQPTYLIHGTNDYTGVGRRSSSGCIRMLPEDVEVLFNSVKIGTMVLIINAPYKAGWDKGKLYLEAHVPLQDQQTSGGGVDLSTMRNVVKAATKAHSGELRWQQAEQIAKDQTGVPQVIGSVNQT